MTPSHHPEEPCPHGRWKHGAIPVIGLIGGIGSGKSRVASLLAARGAAVIPADAVGHELLGEPAIRAQITKRFGTGVLEEPREDGASIPPIDRRALGAIVFADPTARQALEAILHPAMRARFRQTIAHLTQQGGPDFVVLDAAILLEASWDDLCDRIVFVDAPRRERLRRVAETRGWSEETFEARERAQWPADEKRRRADWIMINDAGTDRLQEEVDRLVSRLLEPAASSQRSVAARLGHRAGPAGGSIPDKLVLNVHVHTPWGRMS
jgi:dephospho-CoA kinase